MRSLKEQEQEQEQEQGPSPPLARPVPPLPGHPRRTRHPQRRPRRGVLLVLVTVFIIRPRRSQGLLFKHCCKCDAGNVI